ncbi:MAG: hypothetical protein E7K14_05435 [Bacillota bacterium]|nr:hypothetical protein [Bacillota bacterium]
MAARQIFHDEFHVFPYLEAWLEGQLELFNDASPEYLVPDTERNISGDAAVKPVYADAVRPGGKFVRHAPSRFPRGGVVIKTAADSQFCMSGLYHPEQAFRHVRFRPVIRIQHLNIGSAGQLQSRIPGVGDASVFLVDDLESSVPGCVSVQHGRAFVGRAVVNADGFPVLECLGQQRIQAGLQIRRNVMDGNDDADGWD